jgi:hypothetical protein
VGAHQRRWFESLPNGSFEPVDSSHFIQAEQPEIVAENIRGGTVALSDPAP